MRYQVKAGDSPTIIARMFGVPFDALIRANRFKPTTVVDGQTTWAGLAPNEEIEVPVAGSVGDAAIDAANALANVNPCDRANVALVCNFQRAIGFTGLYVDGKYGQQLAAEVKKRAGHAPAGCSPRPSWWTPAGQSNCVPGSAPVPTVTPVSTPSGSGVSSAASAAFAALSADPNYCSSVKRSGSAVNTGVHNFKAAWNAANPQNPVPINTGNYEPSVAAALSAALGGVAAPPGCGAVVSTPAPTAAVQPPPVQTPIVSPATPPPAHSAYSGAQIAAATAMNSALTAHGYKRGDQGLYMAFQRAMGLSPIDGFPGAGTMGTLRAVLGSDGIPVAAVKVYPWRSGAYDGVNAPTQSEWGGTPVPVAAVPVPPPVIVPATATTPPVVVPPPPPPPAPVVTPPPPTSSAAPPPPAPVVVPPPATPVPGPAQPIVVAPEPPKKLSTGAIVAGTIGAAALVGLIAVAASGKKGHRGARGARGARGRKTSKHKPKHAHKSTHKKSKRRK